eukprot:32521-Eustigmatos_ZCMA.PRE.1
MQELVAVLVWRCNLSNSGQDIAEAALDSRKASIHLDGLIGEAVCLFQDHAGNAAPLRVQLCHALLTDMG